MNTAATAHPVGPVARPPRARAVAISMAAVPLTTPVLRSARRRKHQGHPRWGELRPGHDEPNARDRSVEAGKEHTERD